MASWLTDLDGAIGWLESHAAVVPASAGDTLPADFREFLRNDRGDILNALAVALRLKLLLVTDDLPTRQMAASFGTVGTSWTHHLLGAALVGKAVPRETFIRWSAHLVEAGHDYLGVSGDSLLGALEIDAGSGPSPGPVFSSLIRMIGGPRADPNSHLASVLGCLLALWSRRAGGIDRERATSFLLRRLISGRWEDFGMILKALLIGVRGDPALTSFVLLWTRGNFIPASAIFAPRAVSPRRR